MPANLKRILYLIIILTLIIGAGKLIPVLFQKLAVGSVLTEFKWKKSTPTPATPNPPSPRQDSSFDWKATLLEEFLGYYELPSKILYKNPGNHWNIYVPRGIPLSQYGLSVIKIARKMGIDSIRGHVPKSSVPKMLFHFQNGKDSLFLRFQKGRSYKEGSYKLALVWTETDSLQKTDLESFQNASQNYSIVVDPYNSNPNLQALSRLPRLEILLTLPLEPFNYPYVQPGKDALFIHHSEKKVAELMRERLDQIPLAKGFATQHGSRAIENHGMLRKILAFAQPRNLQLLDLTGSQRSVTLQVCQELSSSCQRTREVSTITTELLEKKIRLAKKYGLSLLVASYSTNNFQRTEQFFKERNLEKEGIEIVTLSNMTLLPGYPSPSEEQHAQAQR